MLLHEGFARLYKWLAWIAAFAASAYMLAAYEGMIGANMFTLGPVGYGLLALVGLCGWMYVREFLAFQRYVCSFSHGENENQKGEVKI